METHQLTNKTKRELIGLSIGFTINKDYPFEIRKKSFEGFLKDFFKMEIQDAIRHIDNMYNDKKLWDSLHPINSIMREDGEGKLWMDRNTIDKIRLNLGVFLQEFKNK